MKKKVLLLGLFLLSLPMMAQQEVNALTAPSSPAAAVLGIQPGTVLAPKSFKALEAALYSNFTDGNGSGVIPDDFGLEFSPYWAVGHGLSLREYFFPQSILQQLIRNSSFSVASSQRFLLEDSTQTKTLGLGYRTSIFIGGNKDRDTINASLVILNRVSLVRTSLASDFITASLDPANATRGAYLTAGLRSKLASYIEAQIGDQAQAEIQAEAIFARVLELPFDPDNKDVFFAAVADIVSDVMKDSFESLKSYIKAREGITADIAYASFLSFPSGDFEFSMVPRQSVWLNAGYQFNAHKAKINALAVFRYEWYNTDYFERYFPSRTIYENNFDYGLSLNAELARFSLQFEATWRSSGSYTSAGTDANGNELFTRDHSTDSQYFAKFNYRLTKGILVSYQIGSSYRPAFSGGGDLISMLALNFGFGGPQ